MNESIYRLIKLPDLVTLINALLGFTAILMMVQSPSNACHASILIILAVIADGLDGAIARSMEYGLLGENLDSLADVISFGLAPAVIAYAILAPQYHNLICVVGGAFLACGILRLARFNAISAMDGFVGLPITTSGLAVVLYVLVFYDMEWQFFSHGLLALMSILAILMISRVHYPKIRNIKYLGLLAVLMIIVVLLFYLGNIGGVRMTAGLSLVVIGSYLFIPLFKIGTWSRF
ncbi:MAG TPA: CDP-diacylglycerol--serine O-phosphatidyltransferase [Methanosarcinales archaeon]|nr:CDP-diacylglycerol--serine O-phosphatidyltransferase [Methanosarcinales archaeon]